MRTVARMKLVFSLVQPPPAHNDSQFTGEVTSTQSSPGWPRRFEQVYPWVYQVLDITAPILADSSQKERSAETRTRCLREISSESKATLPHDILLIPHLSKRWCQFGLLSSHSRLHGSGTHRVPWLIDDEAVSVLSKFVKLKGTLEPYLTTISINDAVGQGHPLMRPLFLEYPEDPNTWHLDQQYMLGPSLLVAPVFGKSRVQYYVPKGSWTNLLTGKSSVGPTWEVEDHDMFTLPLLLRPETILVLGRDGHSVTDCVDQRGLKVVMSRSQTSTISTQLTLRSGSTVKVTVEPIFEASKLCGFKADVVGTKGEVELVVIGDDQGLDHPNCPSASAKGSSCVVKL